jgi:hypothetical protein
MKRREFLIRIAGAGLAVPAVLKVAACGGGGDGGNNDTMSFVVQNSSSDGADHSHTFRVQCDEIMAGGALSFLATGSGHTHSVPLSAAEVATVSDGGSVTVNTSDGGHDHIWMVSMPANACVPSEG